MTFKGTSQLLRYSGPSQLRQGLRDLFLRGIEIFQFVQQEFIDGIYAHVCSFPYNRVLADLAREQSGTSALVVLMPDGLRFGSCHGDLYFDPVDAVCGVVAGWSRARPDSSTGAVTSLAPCQVLSSATSVALIRAID